MLVQGTTASDRTTAPKRLAAAIDPCVRNLRARSQPQRRGTWRHARGCPRAHSRPYHTRARYLDEHLAGLGFGHGQLLDDGHISEARTHLLPPDRPVRRRYPLAQRDRLRAPRAPRSGASERACGRRRARLAPAGARGHTAEEAAGLDASGGGAQARGVAPTAARLEMHRALGGAKAPALTTAPSTTSSRASSAMVLWVQNKVWEVP